MEPQSLPENLGPFSLKAQVSAIADDLSLAAKLADMAAQVVASLADTRYTGEGFIDAGAGVFHVDCSEFVTYLLGVVAKNHLAALSHAGDRPHAADYFEFAAALPKTLDHGWRQIVDLRTAVRGDVMAWRHGDAAHDTGHVFIIAGAPAPAADELLAVPVADSSAVRHFDDSRGSGAPFMDGVGTGTIHFRVDPDGAPTAFKFGAGDHLFPAPMAIARLEPFSAG